MQDSRCSILDKHCTSGEGLEAFSILVCSCGLQGTERSGWIYHRENVLISKIYCLLQGEQIGKRALFLHMSCGQLGKLLSSKSIHLLSRMKEREPTSLGSLGAADWVPQNFQGEGKEIVKGECVCVRVACLFPTLVPGPWTQSPCSCVCARVRACIALGVCSYLGPALHIFC